MPSLSMTQGDTLEFEVAATDAEGAVVNLTGYLLTVTAKLDRSDPDSEAVFQKTWASGGIVVANPATGIGLVTVNPADTAGIEPFRLLFYDAQYQAPNAGAVRTFERGTIFVAPGSTGTRSS